MLDEKLPIKKLFAKKIEVKFKMFGPSMMNGIFIESYTTEVVTPDR